MCDALCDPQSRGRAEQALGARGVAGPRSLGRGCTHRGRPEAPWRRDAPRGGVGALERCSGAPAPHPACWGARLVVARGAGAHAGWPRECRAGATPPRGARGPSRGVAGASPRRLCGDLGGGMRCCRVQRGLRQRGCCGGRGWRPGPPRTYGDKSVTAVPGPWRAAALAWGPGGRLQGEVFP